MVIKLTNKELIEAPINIKGKYVAFLPYLNKNSSAMVCFKYFGVTGEYTNWENNAPN